MKELITLVAGGAFLGVTLSFHFGWNSDLASATMASLAGLMSIIEMVKESKWFGRLRNGEK